MDISAFDFSPAELSELLVELATWRRRSTSSRAFTTKTRRRRQLRASFKMHEVSLDPRSGFDAAFRSGDNVIAQFATLESSAGRFLGSGSRRFVRSGMDMLESLQADRDVQRVSRPPSALARASCGSASSFCAAPLSTSGKRCP